MKKISEVIDHLIKTKPFLEEALMYNFLNLSAFAEYSKNYIEKETHKEVSIHAIKMALSRANIHTNSLMYTHFLGFENIAIKKNLSIISIVRNPKNTDILNRFIAKKSKLENEIFSIIEGFHEIDIIFDSLHFEEIVLLFPISEQLLHLNNLGLISCRLSTEEISTPGLFYQVSKRLMFENINIIQVLSTYRELGILLSEKDLEKGVQLMMGK